MNELTTLEMLLAVIRGDVPVAEAKKADKATEAESANTVQLCYLGKNGFEFRAPSSSGGLRPELHYPYYPILQNSTLQFTYEEEEVTFTTEQIHAKLAGGVFKSFGYVRAMSLPDSWYSVDSIEVIGAPTDKVTMSIQKEQNVYPRNFILQIAFNKKPSLAGPSSSSVVADDEEDEFDFTIKFTGKVRKVYLWPKE